MASRKTGKKPDPTVRTIDAQVKTLTAEQMAALRSSPAFHFLILKLFDSIFKTNGPLPAESSEATPDPQTKRKASGWPLPSPATPSPKKTRVELTPSTSRVMFVSLHTLSYVFFTELHFCFLDVLNLLVLRIFKRTARQPFTDSAAHDAGEASEVSASEDSGDLSDGLHDFIVANTEDVEEEESGASVTDEDAHSAASNAARLKAKFCKEALSKEPPFASTLLSNNAVTLDAPGQHGEPEAMLKHPPVTRPDIQDPLMFGSYEGLPYLEKCLQLVPHSYDQTIDNGCISHCHISQVVPVLPAEDALSLRNVLHLVRIAHYVNLAHIDPADLVATKFNQLALRGEGAFCVCITSGVVTTSHLFDSSVTISARNGDYRQHRISIVPFHQEELREVAVLGHVLHLSDGTKANVSHNGYAFVTRGEGKATMIDPTHPFIPEGGYAMPEKPAAPAALSSPFISVSSERRRPPPNIHDPFKAVIDYEEFVPVYDGRSSTGRPFQFTKEDFDNILTWRAFGGNRTEVPKDSVVAVGYSANSYGGSKDEMRSNGDTFLTLNVLFVVVLYVPVYEVGINPALPDVEGDGSALALASSSKKGKGRKGKGKA
ncbi:hypothetical protein DXG01_003649 [Tephrocybe rancida]|nr:hypothetical protein DXG01_003649 [Tephrocybe rancida]